MNLTECRSLSSLSWDGSSFTLPYRQSTLLEKGTKLYGARIGFGVFLFSAIFILSFPAGQPGNRTAGLSVLVRFQQIMYRITATKFAVDSNFFLQNAVGCFFLQPDGFQPIFRQENTNLFQITEKRASSSSSIVSPSGVFPNKHG